MNNPEIPELPLPISLKAQRKLKEYASSLKLKDGTGVRIGLKKQGVHQKKVIGFDDKRFTDATYQLEGLTFYIDRRELKQLEGYRVDYQESSEGKGFLFEEQKAE